MTRKLVTSIVEYLSMILEVRDAFSCGVAYEDVWYRGVRDNKLDLLPGAYWRHAAPPVIPAKAGTHLPPTHSSNSAMP